MLERWKAKASAFSSLILTQVLSSLKIGEEECLYCNIRPVAVQSDWLVFVNGAI
jgi:hypothetical protein